ncbi:hypothetical protein LTR66_004043 [Elasticomyces elasticus]|nr:hypothetical protein LTR66_004043 [Elasticomyces elasticus]
MVKALSFKGDKKVKKRKRPAGDDDGAPTSRDLAVVSAPVEEDVQEDNWVSAEAITDIAGPVIFVLPTAPTACIACDAHGKVFASRIENMVEGEAGTAEPHDVRQVWVANRVAGTDGFSFKGHHGKYLGCDKYGIPSATREAISPEESFICVPSTDEPGTFSLQTVHNKFITVDDDKATPEVRGDAEGDGVNTSLRIRMQARFKPRLKADKAEKALAKISRKQLEDEVGRRLEDDEVKKLKKARREGNYHEAMLDVKVKGKHDKFA